VLEVPRGRIALSAVARPYLYATSVIEGAAVMAVELISARMIGVYFGTSLYVWAAVLAVTLLGLATGYYAGGWVSRRWPAPAVLFGIVGLSAVLVALMPGWSAAVMRWSLGLEIQRASLVSAMAFLFPPLVCFGTVSPLIVNLVAREHGDAGRAAGTVYAISTAGGIVMTLVAGFWLIPSLGLRASTLGVAALLALPALGFFVLRRRLAPALLVAIPLSLALLGGADGERIKREGAYKVLHVSDGLLGQLAVLEMERPDTQEIVRVLLINNVSQNLVHVPTFRSKWRYVHRLALYASIQPAGTRALVCGLGGGNLINELDRLGFDLDVVEIDPRMEGLAREFFGMNGPARVFVDDARHFINTSTSTWGLVIFDMASGDVQPVNVYTVEAFREVRKRLAPDGMLFVHYQNRRAGPDGLAARSIGRTLEQAGFAVRLLDTGVDPQHIGEIIFVAGHDASLFDRLAGSTFERRDPFADPFGFPRGPAMFLDDSFEGGLVLTDDWPILERLHQPAVDEMRGEAYRTQLTDLLADHVRFY